MPINHPSELKYEIYREAARRVTVDRMYNLASAKLASREILFGMHMTGITDDAIHHAERDCEFPWRQICGQLRPYVRRFEAAIWMGGALCGLCIGRPSRGSDNLTIHFIERCNSILKGEIAIIGIDAADNYARLIDRHRLKLKNPIAGAQPVYAELGFTLAEIIDGVTYYERKVAP